MYLHSGVPMHFHCRFVAVLTQNSTVSMCVYQRHPQTLVEVCRNMCICDVFRTVATRENISGKKLLNLITNLITHSPMNISFQGHGGYLDRVVGADHAHHHPGPFRVGRDGGQWMEGFLDVPAGSQPHGLRCDRCAGLPHHSLRSQE